MLKSAQLRAFHHSWRQLNMLSASYRKWVSKPSPKYFSSSINCNLIFGGRPAEPLSWLPLWLMPPGVSNDLRFCAIAGVLRRVPFPPKVELFNFLWTVSGAVSVSVCFFATVQLRLSRWCWWPGGWLCCLYASARPWLDGGRFLLRMLELRDVDGGVFPVWDCSKSRFCVFAIEALLDFF